jgi:hypothetical protein
MQTQVHVATAHTTMPAQSGRTNPGAAGSSFLQTAPAPQRGGAPNPGGDPDPGGPMGGGGGGGHYPGANPGGNPNPMPGGPPGGGGGGPQQNPVVAAQPQGGENGSLQGSAPTIFNGDRSKTEHFMREFELYRLINVRNNKMTTPSSRVALALSFIKGDKVNTWVFNQANQLAIRLYGDVNHAPTHDPGDEDLWRDFVREFKAAFAHTASKEEAYAALQKLEMKGHDIDGYIAKFEDLIVQAEWERGAAGTIELFKDGLPSWLTYRMLSNRLHVPIGMDGWQMAAREEIERAALISASLGPKRGKGGDSTRRTKFLALVNQKTRRDPDAMDVDVNLAKTGQLSKQEREKLSKEGRCFFCKKQGHMARNCPDRPKRTTPFPGKDKGKPPFKAKASQVEVVDDREEKDKEESAEEPPPYEDDKALIAKIRKMKTEDRDRLLDSLVEEDFI